MSGVVALEAAADLGVGLLLPAPAGEVVPGGFLTVDHAPIDDGVQGTVELAVAEAVEPVPGDTAGGCRQRADAGERGERGFGAAPAGMNFPPSPDIRGLGSTAVI